jgi:dTDP-4-dehydrorhamnose reductase
MRAGGKISYRENIGGRVGSKELGVGGKRQKADVSRPTPYALRHTNQNPKRILITGAKGMLGQMLEEVLGTDNDLVLVDKEEMDVTNAKQVREVIFHNKPDVIVHGAAYVNVDEAEDDIKQCNRINVEGSENIARVAEEIGAKLVYISTDYVFDGQKSTPYLESDSVNPLGVYAKSKLDGEVAVAKFCPRHYILRVAWLFGESKSGKNFVDTMIGLSKTKPSLGVINDQIGSPTYTRDLAEIIKLIIEKNIPFGIYHFSGTGESTRYDFTKEIFRQLEIKTDLRPIGTKDFPAKAARPSYSYLSKSKIENALRIKVRPWQEMLSDYLERTKHRNI